jgi:hypothetical protein
MVGKPAWRRLSGLVHVSPGEERPPTWADRANYVWEKERQAVAHEPSAWLPTE